MSVGPCPTCHQWASEYPPHACRGPAPRCDNPKCRRILSAVMPRPYEGQLCTRCQVRDAIRGELPANTGRPRQAPTIAEQMRAGVADLERRRGEQAQAEAPAEVTPPVPWWRRALFG